MQYRKEIYSCAKYWFSYTQEKKAPEKLNSSQIFPCWPSFISDLQPCLLLYALLSWVNLHLSGNLIPLPRGFGLISDTISLSLAEFFSIERTAVPHPSPFENFTPIYPLKTFQDSGGWMRKGTFVITPPVWVVGTPFLFFFFLSSLQSANVPWDSVVPTLEEEAQYSPRRPWFPVDLLQEYLMLPWRAVLGWFSPLRPA